MRKLIRAFGYALEGIIHGLKNERNLRLHFLATLCVIIAGLLTGLSFVEWFIVLVLFGGMLSLEMLNSSIERVVDLVSTEQHPLAKQAKDLAAGAVLVFAIISAIIGLLLFLPKWIN